MTPLLVNLRIIVALVLPVETLSLPLLVQTAPIDIQSRIVPSGVERQIGFFTSLNSDCSSTGEVVGRISIQPKSGTVELDQGPGYPNFAMFNQRYGCNRVLVEGYRVKYTSKPDFTGADTVEVEFFTPSGQQVTWKYNISVK